MSDTRHKVPATEGGASTAAGCKAGKAATIVRKERSVAASDSDSDTKAQESAEVNELADALHAELALGAEAADEAPAIKNKVRLHRALTTLRDGITLPMHQCACASRIPPARQRTTPPSRVRGQDGFGPTLLATRCAAC
jgi:hypothetical protein